MKLLNYVLIIFCLIFMSCQENETSDKIICEFENWNYSDYFNLDTLIKLETSEECLITKIDRIIKKNNRLFILDNTNKSLFVYTSKGEYIDKINPIGKGPGEYLNLVDMEVDDSAIYILAWTKRQKLLKYDWDLNLISENSPPVRAHAFKHYQDRWIFYSGNINDEKLKNGHSFYNLSFFDNDYNLLNNYLPYNDSYNGRASYYGGSGANRFFESNDGRLIFSEPYNNSIYFLSRDGIDSSITVYNGSPDLKPYKEEMKSDAFIKKIMEGNSILSLSSFYLLEDILIFNLHTNNYVARCINTPSGVKMVKREGKGIDPDFKISTTFTKGFDYDNNRIISIIHPIFLINYYKNGEDRFPFISSVAKNTQRTDNPSIVFLSLKE